MKRKILAFAIVSLLSLTVTSCQTETKLDPNDGKELIATSLNKSKQDVIEALNGDFVGADIKMDSTLGFKANYVDDISASTQPDIKINDIDLSEVVKNSGTFLFASSNPNAVEVDNHATPSF